MEHVSLLTAQRLIEVSILILPEERMEQVGG